MLKKFAPAFLNKIDSDLLEKHPVLWMSKIHYMLWYGALLAAVSGILGCLVPFDIEKSIPFELWYFLFTLIGIVLLCVWTYNYMIFNKEKHFGTKSTVDAYSNFALVFLSVAICLLLPWPLQFGLNQRVAASYTQEEVMHDLNVLNETYPYVVDSYGKYNTWQDTSDREYFNMKSLSYYSDLFTPYFMSSKSSEYRQLTPNQAIVDKYTTAIPPKQLRANIQLFLSTAEKYHGYYRHDMDYYTDKFLTLARLKSIPMDSLNYDTDDESSAVRDVIRNVSESQYFQPYFFKMSYFLTLFFITLFLATLLSLFKMVYWKQYLLVAVIFIFYPIIAFIFSQLLPHMNHNSRDASFQTWLTAFVVLSAISLFLSRSRPYFRPFINCMNQAFYVLCAYVPFLLILLIYDQTDVFHNHDYLYWPDESETVVKNAKEYAEQYKSHLLYDYWQAEFQRWLTGSLFFGITAFVLALPLFRELFTKQLALPKKA